MPSWDWTHSVDRALDLGPSWCTRWRRRHREPLSRAISHNKVSKYHGVVRLRCWGLQPCHQLAAFTNNVGDDKIATLEEDWHSTTRRRPIDCSSCCPSVQPICLGLTGPHEVLFVFCSWSVVGGRGKIDRTWWSIGKRSSIGGLSSTLSGTLPSPSLELMSRAPLGPLLVPV